MSAAQDRARELLAGITPGPWLKREHGDEMWVSAMHNNVVTGELILPDPDDEQAAFRLVDRNHEFISAAPDLVRDLIAELEANEEQSSGDLNTIAEACMRSGIQYDKSIDVEWVDWPLRVIHSLRTERDAALATLAEVRELHDSNGERWVGFPRAERREAYCTYCQEAAPCRTIATLDRGQQ